MSEKLDAIKEYLSELSSGGAVVIDKMGDTRPYWYWEIPSADRATNLFSATVQLISIIDGVQEAIDAIDEQVAEGAFNRAARAKELAISARAAALVEGEEMTMEEAMVIGIDNYVDELKSEIRETSRLKAGVINGLAMSLIERHGKNPNAHDDMLEDVYGLEAE